jgi:hypothetical protein
VQAVQAEVTNTPAPSTGADSSLGIAGLRDTNG